MFNVSLKNDALAVHRNAAERYDASYKLMMEEASKLYNARIESTALIVKIENFINTIANTPKDFDKKLGLIKAELQRFRETESYAKEALENEIKSGIGVAAGIAAGGTFAGMAPTVAMQIATTFGRASTGTAIKALSGAAAQKAALAWLGGGALSAGGAGVAGGKALLALAGPIGWSLSAVSVGISLGSMTRKNKKTADQAIAEAKNIMIAKEGLDETTKKVEDLKNRTNKLWEELESERVGLEHLKNADYNELDSDDRKRLGTLVNHTFTMASLLNQIVEDK